MHPSDLPEPTSPAARAALAVATRYCSPALLNHSARSYLWGAALGISASLEFDAELLYVSALLHDLGLVEAFDSHRLPFEEAGGHVAWVFGAGAGWDADRCARAAEIIVRHMREPVSPDADPEGFLLQRATSLDISGRRVESVSAGLRAEVLQRWPRLSLATEFSACFADQAARKPGSAAAEAIRSGIADRLAANPLENE
ncbi:MAG TPA: HD domain-containing protein [Blastococcus sp.]